MEIGCGNGLLGKLIIKDLVKQKKDFSYCFTDLVTDCLKKTEKNVGKFSKLVQVSFKQLDVYQADKQLGKETQQVIISTGFAAAATYKQAVPKVTKTLRKRGVLIADFINHFSPPISRLNLINQ